MKYIKYLIKKIYMILFHGFLLIRVKSVGKSFYIGRRSKINKYQYLNIKDNVRIGDDARLSFYYKFNDEILKPRLIIGNRSYIGNHFTVLCADEIVLEDDVLIASYVMISSENHGINPECSLPYGKQSLTTKKVRVCQGVWIGEKVSILPGVTIGEKSIIGTGSVVTKDIPAYSIAVGNPARVIKEYCLTEHKWKNKEE